MPGQRLMCVWETASLVSPAEGKKSPGCQTIKALIINILRDCSNAKFYSSMFEEMFYSKGVTFEKFKIYIRQCVHDTSVPFTILEDHIEKKCWQQCQDFYNIKSSGIDAVSAKNLWQVYVRLLEVDSFPSVVAHEDLEWFSNQMETSLNQQSAPSNPPKRNGAKKGYYTFPDFMEAIVSRFHGRLSEDVLKQTIDEMHSWLVKEISMAGWLYKRKRKQLNWTGWLQRWFILTPGLLTYYDGPKCEVKKGEISVTSRSVLSTVPCQKKPALLKKSGFGFKLVNAPYIEMEMSANTESEYNLWLKNLQDMVESSKLGSTQIQMLLEKRRRSTVQENEERLRSIKERSGTINRISRGWFEYDPTMIKPESSFPIMLVPSMNVDDSNSTVQDSTEKIRALFNRCDTNGNGYIDRSEFRSFIKEFCKYDFDTEDLDEMFNGIDRDNSDSLTFDEFYNYFIDFVLNTSYELSFTEDKVKTTFLKADKEGKSVVNFEDFTDATEDVNRLHKIKYLLKSFKKMAEFGDEDEPVKELTDMLSVINEETTADLDDWEAGGEDGHEEENGEGNAAGDVNAPTSRNIIQKRLKSVYKKAELQNMAGYIRERWTKFASFKRYGASGDLVMKGSSGMVADVLPGQYNLLDLACFSDRESIQPKRVVIKGARWVKSPDPGKSGMIIFPSDYDGSIPVDIATSEHARYYGCHLADSTQIKVSLLYRHGIQDFTYQNNYLTDYVKDKNGPGLEKHDFSHLDCPLEDDSGYFILGKIVQGVKHEELHLTAFLVPTRHTLYVPGNTIHSNDYLKGTWRTMLSDEADIDHYHVMKRVNNVHNVGPQPFTFKMYGRLAVPETVEVTKL